ncbi:MAG: hypothetical protein PVI11_09325 [Candidatus Aminicenantes bacterium]
MKLKLIILLLFVCLVACSTVERKFSPEDIQPGLVKVLARGENDDGNYLVTAPLVRQYYLNCLRESGNADYCMMKIHTLIVAENLDGTYWVKPEMVKEFQKQKEKK